VPLPSNDIITMMKDAAWHAELPGPGEAGMRDYLERQYPHASPYQRRRALELATQAIGVGLALRELGPRDVLRTGLQGARAPAQTVGVRVRLNYSSAVPEPGYKGKRPEWVTKYVPMSWDATVGEIGEAIREMLTIAGYSEDQIKAIVKAGQRTAEAVAKETGREYYGQWWEFVGPTLFPIT
jgi:hypothetical protein